MYKKEKPKLGSKKSINDEARVGVLGRVGGGGVGTEGRKMDEVSMRGARYVCAGTDWSSGERSKALEIEESDIWRTFKLS
jgi:hypothetical protein